VTLPAPIPSLVSIASKHSVTEALARLEAILAARGLRIFARIDFSGDARRAGLDLRPMMQVVFGNPKAGTPLLVAAPTMGIDLPLRVLIWQDANGAVWLSYNDPDFLAQRHGVPAELIRNIAGIRALVAEAAA
jgi:uncharacterized protein (DUF302 family)